MPTYDYICTSCGNAWEQEQRIVEDPIKQCPKCGDQTAKRQISAGAGFILKGGGWYADLYGSKPSSSESKTEDKSANTDTKSDTSSTKAGDSKSDSKSDSSSKSESKGDKGGKSDSTGGDKPSSSGDKPSSGGGSNKAA